MTKTSRKAEKAEERRKYRSMWPKSKKSRHKWRELDKQQRCPECKTRHNPKEECPQLPRIVHIK